MTSKRNGLATIALSLAVLALSVGIGAATPQHARADHDINTPFTGTRPFQLDFHGGFTWYGLGFAGGARFGIPLIHNGPIPTLDNAFYLNFGADFYFLQDWGHCRDTGGGACVYYGEYRFAMGFPVTAHWEFYFNDTWSAFAELGFQVFLPPGLFHRGQVDYRDHIGQWIVAAVGGSLHLGEVFALTLRVGNPYISFGVTLNLG